jgi:hypothetical protein
MEANGQCLLETIVCLESALSALREWQMIAASRDDQFCGLNTLIPLMEDEHVST